MAKVKRATPLEGETWDLSLGAVQHTSRWGTIARSKGSRLRYYPGCPWEKRPEPPLAGIGALLRGWRGRLNYHFGVWYYAYIDALTIFQDGQPVLTRWRYQAVPTMPGTGAYLPGPAIGVAIREDLGAVQCRYASITPIGWSCAGFGWLDARTDYNPPPPIRGTLLYIVASPALDPNTSPDPDYAPTLTESVHIGPVPSAYTQRLLNGDPMPPLSPHIRLRAFPYSLSMGREDYAALNLLWEVSPVGDYQGSIELAYQDRSPVPSNLFYLIGTTLDGMCQSDFPNRVFLNTTSEVAPGSYTLLLVVRTASGTWYSDPIEVTVQ